MLNFGYLKEDLINWGNTMIKSGKFIGVKGN